MKNAKFELPEGRWLVVVKNGQARIKNMDGWITLSEDSFLKLKKKFHEASLILAEIKGLV